MEVVVGGMEGEGEEEGMEEGEVDMGEEEEGS